jgi:hypothetical protein
VCVFVKGSMAHLCIRDFMWGPEVVDNGFCQYKPLHSSLELTYHHAFNVHYGPWKFGFQP